MAEDQFEVVLEALRSGIVPSREALVGLAHLMPEQAGRLSHPWSGLPTAAKVRLLVQLHEAETNNLRLDFNEVYRLGMNDPDPVVRRGAVLAVVEDSGEALETRLVSMLAEDPDPGARMAAAQRLGDLARAGELGEISPVRARRVRAALLAAVQGPDQGLGLRAAALVSLGYFSDSTVQNLIGISYGDERLKGAAVRSMGRSADEAWTDWLIRDLSSADDELRLAATEACGQVGDERAVGSLIPLVDDEEVGIRLAAVRSLGEIGGEEAREALLYAIAGSDEKVSEAAEAALDSMESLESDRL
ncbi:MAG: HEAT repeat domain-containing protein [Chloroflexi bacterium]|nr:HEAT repeat domain-containing protein [Chloroflexota bacterium]